MLIQASNISPGDTIVTSVYQEGCQVSQVYLLEDGSVRVEYETGKLEWLGSNQIVVRKDKHQNFFSGHMYNNS
jgi:hypothetical protein